MISFSLPSSIEEAKKEQEKLAQKVRLTPLLQPPRLVAGCDISFSRGSNTAYYAILLFSLPHLTPLEIHQGSHPMQFPYIPGLLAFREIPVLLKGLEKLSQQPDVIVVDGHGIAHPRRMGIATHLGLLLDLPTVGCAKNLLVGTYGDLPDSPGAFTPIFWKGSQIGYALRSRKKAKPIFISPGHKIDFDDSLNVIQEFLKGYRMPEVTRLAHLYANQARKKGETNGKNGMDEKDSEILE